MSAKFKKKLNPSYTNIEYSKTYRQILTFICHKFCQVTALGPVVQSIASLTKSFIKDLLNLPSCANIVWLRNFCIRIVSAKNASVFVYNTFENLMSL